MYVCACVCVCVCVCVGAACTDQSTEVWLELQGGAKPPPDAKSGFIIAYLWKSTSYDRYAYPYQHTHRERERD
jgi:hypothetical protein